jgi:hypothetical protein
MSSCVVIVVCNGKSQRPQHGQTYLTRDEKANSPAKIQGLRGCLGLLCSLFCYSAPPNACQTGQTPATLLSKKCRVELNSTVLLEQQNRCSRKNSFQRRHGVVGKLPTMPSIMKKRFTVSSTAVCLTHSLPWTSNRSTSASLTRNPSCRPWRAL